MKKIYNNLAFVILSLSFSSGLKAKNQGTLDILAAKPDMKEGVQSRNYHPNLNFLDNGIIATNESLKSIDADALDKSIKITLKEETLKKIKSTIADNDDTRLAFIYEGNVFISDKSLPKNIETQSLELNFSNHQDFSRIHTALTKIS